MGRVRHRADLLWATVMIAASRERDETQDEDRDDHDDDPPTTGHL
jgi:hypothetical protein